MGPNAASRLESLEPRTLLSAAAPSHFILADGANGPIWPAAGDAAKYTINNGGFETFTPNDLQGWNIGGNAASVIGDYYTAPEGISQALISNGPANNGPGGQSPLTAAGLESFLGLKTGSLAKKGVTNGSAVKQTFKAGALELLTFQLDFLTNETTKNDFGFITINNGRETDLYKITDLLHPTTPGGSGSTMLSETGYGKYTLLLPRGGTYTIGFGVTNVGAAVGLSTVLVDNVKLTPLFPFDFHLKDLFPDNGPSLQPMSF